MIIKNKFKIILFALENDSELYKIYPHWIFYISIEPKNILTTFSELFKIMLVVIGISGYDTNPWVIPNNPF